MCMISKLRRNARAGFTMAEVITVIAIIAVLIAIAVPSALAIRKNLKMLELDNYAKSIYVAAQNRMSELRISGELTFENISVPDSSLGGAAMSVMPSDYPEELGAWVPDKYFCLSSVTNADAMSSLLPAGAVEAVVFGGYFYIEYNAATGMVYGVFYAEESFDYSSGGLPREKSLRRAHDPMLGYYGGSDIDFDSVDFAEIPDFYIVNDEKLYIVLKGETGVMYTVVVSDGDNEWTFSTETGQLEWPVNVSESGGEYTILLDSLEAEMQFKDLLSGLTPGADITVTVTASEDDKIPTSNSKITNSLFAVVSGETATVSYCRHLQNLDTEFSGVTDTVTEGVLAMNLDWADADIDEFTSIDNENLRSFTGGGNSIKNLNAALFDKFGGSGAERAEISGVNLINPKINTSGTTAVNRGTLVNTASYVVFEKCQVYAALENEGDAFGVDSCSLVSSGVGNTGGLIGLATYCDISECSASLTKISADSGNVGGLVGGAVSTNITKSYADTGLWDKDNAVWAENSGIILSAGQVAGGLVGELKGGSVITCYAIGNIKAASGLVASGFVGDVTSGATVSESYCVTTFEGGGTQNVYGFAHLSTGSIEDGSCYYFKSDAVNGSQKGTAVTVDEMADIFQDNDDWQTANKNTTKPYARVDEALPFKRLTGIIHYGDWPDLEVKGVVYYYEKYDDGNGGFIFGYYPTISGKGLRNDLVVKDDGYILILEDSEFQAENDVIEFECRGMSAPNNFFDVKFQAADSADGWESFNNKTVYPITDEHFSKMKPANVETIIYEMEIGNECYYINPDFAMSVTTGDIGARPNMVYIVRTARHLQQLGMKMKHNLETVRDYYNGGNGAVKAVTYRQTRDIDFSTYYSAEYIITPIGPHGQAFTTVYEGGGYSITITGIAGGTRVGLFGQLYGTVQNVNLFSVPGTMVKGTGDSVGALVGEALSGKVINCTVTGVTVEGTANVGGLVGNSGKRTDSSESGAVISGCTIEDVKVTGTGSNIGGFIGRLGSGANVRVENCSATNVIVSGGENIGGFVGVSESTGNISNCTLSSVTVTGSSYKTAGFAGYNLGTITNSAVSGATIVGGASQVGGFVGYNNNGGTITNCSAANGYFGDATIGGSIKGTDATYTAGFAGNNSGTISSSYAIARFAAGSAITAGFTGKNQGSVSDSYCATIDSAGNFVTIFGPASGNVNNVHAYTGLNRAAIMTAFSNDPWGHANATHSFPYDPALMGLAFPFPAVVKDAEGAFVHYGNWPDYIPRGLYYYEKYDDDSYGFHADFLEDGEYNSLKDDKPVSEDGYVFITPGTLSSNPATASFVSEERMSWGWQNRGTDAGVAGESKRYGSTDYTFYFLTPDASVITNSAGNTSLQSFNLLLTMTLSGGQPEAFYFNPNFAKTSINPGEGATDFTPEIHDPVEVRTARQLARLGDLTYNFTNEYNWHGKTYSQTRGIDFGAYNQSYSDQLAFHPIGIRDAFSGTYDGGGNNITGLSIDEDAGIDNWNAGIGLFGTIHENGRVKNVVLRASSTGGVKTNAAVTNSNAGLGTLAGINNGIIENCAAAGYSVTGTGGFTGGFVGVNTGTIRNCSVANAQFYTQTVGGSIDYSEGYAGVGGFVGRNTGEITNCYSMASFPTVKNAWVSVGAFVGRNESGGTIVNSYAATKNSNAEFIQNFCGTETKTGLTNCLTFDEENPEVINTEFAPLSEWGTAVAARSFPYDISLMGGAYPFPAVVKNAEGDYVHHGNWPETVKYEDGLYYYEEYADGSFGFYAEIAGEVYGKLNDEKEIVADGYAFILSGNRPTIKYRSNSQGTSDTSFATASPSDFTSKDIGSGKTAYLITSTLTNKLRLYADSFRTSYFELKIGNLNYYYNQDFAKTAMNPNSSGVTGDIPRDGSGHITEYELRTARHLAMLGKNHNETSNHASYPRNKYIQTRDIDFTTYTDPPAFTYICSNSDYFYGTYDGGNKSITLTGTITSFGLFGRVNGTVQNINLIGASGMTFTSSATERGGLVGTLYGGTISNCSITNVMISGSNSKIGGLVGYITNNGKVENCTVTNVNVNISGDNIGGLAGYIESGTIIGCTVKGNDTTIVKGSGTVGGFVGSLSNTSITDCHVEGISVSGGGNIGGFAGVNNRSISGCTVKEVNVTGTGWYAGGFVGQNSGTVSGCSVIGSETQTTTVTGQPHAGGFVGYNPGSISGCAVLRISVNGTGTLGGFYGAGNRGTINNCTVDGEAVP